KHQKDFLFANDEWFRGMELKSGADGGVFVTDWSDTGECHETDGDVAHRENGRIYKVTYGKPTATAGDLARLDDVELARRHTHQNAWHLRHPRLRLQERAAAGRDMGPVHQVLFKSFEAETAIPKKLRALWALHATGGLGEAGLLRLFAHESEYVRGWAV